MAAYSARLPIQKRFQLPSLLCNAKKAYSAPAQKPKNHHRNHPDNRGQPGLFAVDNPAGEKHEPYIQIHQGNDAPASRDTPCPLWDRVTGSSMSDDIGMCCAACCGSVLLIFLVVFVLGLAVISPLLFVVLIAVFGLILIIYASLAKIKLQRRLLPRSHVKAGVLTLVLAFSDFFALFFVSAAPDETTTRKARAPS